MEGGRHWPAVGRDEHGCGHAQARSTPGPEAAWTIPVPAETGLPVAERRSNVDKGGSTLAASWEEAEAAAGMVRYRSAAGRESRSQCLLPPSIRVYAVALPLHYRSYTPTLMPATRPSRMVCFSILPPSPGHAVWLSRRARQQRRWWPCAPGRPGLPSAGWPCRRVVGIQHRPQGHRGGDGVPADRHDHVARHQPGPGGWRARGDPDDTGPGNSRVCRHRDAVRHDPSAVVADGDVRGGGGWLVALQLWFLPVYLLPIADPGSGTASCSRAITPLRREVVAFRGGSADRPHLGDAIKHTAAGERQAAPSPGQGAAVSGNIDAAGSRVLADQGRRPIQGATGRPLWCGASAAGTGRRRS